MPGAGAAGARAEHICGTAQGNGRLAGAAPPESAQHGHGHGRRAHCGHGHDARHGHARQQHDAAPRCVTACRQRIRALRLKRGI